MKVLTVVGARPQFIKAAVLRKVFFDQHVDEKLVHTGHHYDHNMSDIFFDELGIRAADYKLNLLQRSHAGLTGEVMLGVENILEIEKPDWCLVYGDTNSTLAAALAASKLQVPICHVEAGQRAFNREIPEEINRVLTDHVSDLLFCSTFSAVNNLKNEGIISGVHHVGDVMYDAVKLFTDEVEHHQLSEMVGISIPEDYCLLTIHRSETLTNREKICEILKFAADNSNNLEILFVLHPHTVQKIKSYGIELNRFLCLAPQAYRAMQSLIRNSQLILTDSGGIQKEAYFHSVKCITLRNETEWVETIECGWNRLWTQPDYKGPERPIPEFGDGFCGEKIVQIMKGQK